MTYEEMEAELRDRLPEHRFLHSLGVAQTAVELAARFGVDRKKAQVAGLLHDCAREFATERLPEEATKRGIPIGAPEAHLPLLLHAYVGAHRIEEVYDVHDPEIASAIWKHSVGAEVMSPLDKIIYFADMIEPGRDYPEVGWLRRLAREASLDVMTLAGMSASLAFVLSQGGILHPLTVLARNALLYQGVEMPTRG